ncbi:MAG TPA: carboxypeptidase regulatory-like domain-containing protein [Terriglobales bacterium]|nr:carboxypeptidase regulatory-like domain-containing protein [Terriglobales bacterium]
MTDPSGAVVQNATVTATQTETGLSRAAASRRDGTFLLLELPVGHYRLEVAARGFSKYLQDGILLNVNETATVPVRLAVGTEKQEVNVQADAQLIQGTVTSLGKAVLSRELLSLPLNGRDFSQLGVLQPGVTPITPGLAEAGGTLREGQAYAVNGQRPESNNFLIDGANNFSSVDGGFILKPPIDAIAEFRILTNGANAEFGHSAGSTTNIVTRSGSNNFHGAAWEFLRNDAMDARNYFAQQVEPLKQNQFGGALGGPIRKDKTFFFAYYEGFRNRQGETQSATVPSLLERQGNFSQTIDPSTGKVDPLINEFTGQPFPGNQLPFINPIAQNLLQFFPLPNLGGNTFTATQSLHADNDQFGLRFDHYLSPADTLNFRYMYSNSNTLDPLSTSGASVPGFPVGEDQRAQNFVTQETHTFSPAMIGVARFFFLRNKFLLDQHINHTLPTDLGFQYQPTLAAAAGPPFLQVNGYASIGDPITGPRDTYQNSFDWSGSLTWIRGQHELKFGGGFQHNQINMLQGIASNGFFVFAPFPISNAFASFLFGQPVFFLQGGGDLSRSLRGNSSNAYAQDTYKVTRRLTLNMGLRYELPSPYTEIHNRQNLFVPGAQSRVFPNAPAGLLYPGDPGVPGGLISTDKKAFAPRIGLAWDPTGSAQWLVSAAYGIFYEPYYTGVGGPLQDPISAPPYLQTPQVNLPNFANPFNGANPFTLAFSQPMTLLVLSPGLRLPYAQDWNLNVQRSFGADWLFQIGYVGTTGVKLPRFIEGNPAVFIPGQSSENNANQRRLYSGCTLASPNNCVYGSVGEIAGIANSSYNALQSSLRKRFSHGLSFLASYTFSKSIDDVSSFNITGSAASPVAGENDLPQNPFNLAAERGRSMFDARHRFVLSYEWSLPWWKQPHAWYQHALGNWQLNGITTFMSGTPFTVFDSQDVSLEGTAPEISGFSANRPNLVGDPNSGPQTVQEWFNVNAFQRLNPVTQAGQFGTAGRNIVQGPRLQEWDFSAFKTIPLAESKQLQIRAEFFNVFNHTNFRLPDSDISSPTFGQIQEALPPRLVQLALKFLF